MPVSFDDFNTQVLVVICDKGRIVFNHSYHGNVAQHGCESFINFLFGSASSIPPPIHWNFRVQLGSNPPQVKFMKALRFFLCYSYLEHPQHQYHVHAPLVHNCITVIA